MAAAREIRGIVRGFTASETENAAISITLRGQIVRSLPVSSQQNQWPTETGSSLFLAVDRDFCSQLVSENAQLFSAPTAIRVFLGIGSRLDPELMTTPALPFASVVPLMNSMFVRHPSVP
jgi:hypothetical protein